jgi:hypothetical protein
MTERDQKDEDHTQAGRDVERRAHVLRHQQPTGIVRQEKECNALDYAHKSQLDVNHDRVELAAAISWRSHEPTRNRSMIKLSRCYGSR